MIRHVIPKGNLHAEHKSKAIAEIIALPDNRAWLVQVKQYQRKRSLEQNAFIHAVPLKIISEHTGMEVDDLKSYLLGKAFGFVEFEIFGERRKRPAKRSSELTTGEFSYWMEFIEAWSAQELQLIIPRPNEYLIDEDMK